MISLALQKRLQSSEGPFLLNVEITIPLHSFTILCGDSGAGKTSILRMISGLMTPDSGRIVYQQDVWYDSARKINLNPKDRGLGFVFQEQALFPNMTVRQNLEYALGKTDKQEKVDLLIEQFQLNGLQNRKPVTLSGGQKQKVSLARSIINQPKLLLLDEPLSALDQKRRSRFQDFILKAHQEYQLTTIMVSHDAAEINKMAQAILVLENGQITDSSLQPVKEPSQVSGIITQTSEEQYKIKIEIDIEKKSGTNSLREFSTGDRIWLSGRR